MRAAEEGGGGRVNWRLNNVFSNINGTWYSTELQHKWFEWLMYSFFFSPVVSC